ncbi:phage tail tip fiber protein, partial [Chromobacterium amazonense]|uniref:phage tail tip fiber protein n=1 Tax=Chromobacterium amazonense TaxID=1382803 RepID=UPI003F7A6586
KTWSRLVELAYPTIVWTHLGLAIGATVQYQLRLVDTWGNVGDPVAASATVVQDNDILLSALKGAIDKGQLADGLRQPLERLPELDAAVQAAQQLGSQALNAAMQRVLETDWVDAENKQRFAVVRQDIKKVQDDAQQEVTARLQLAAKLDSTQAGLEDEKKARADAVSAVASAVESLAAKTDKSIAGVRVEIKAAADQAGAVSGRLEEFKSQTAQNLAGVSQQIKSATDAQSATAQKLESYQAQTAQQIAGVRNDISAATGPDSALVRDMQQRIAKSQADAVASANSLTEQRTGPGSALSQSIQQLGSRVGTSETSIQQQAQTINGLMGQWSIKIDRVQNGIAYSSGVVLNNGANGSAFAVLADKFYVALPSGSNVRPVFTVTSINGQPVVGIDGDLIARGTLSGKNALIEGSVEARHIDTRGLSVKNPNGDVVVNWDGVGANWIKGKLTVGQIDTEGLRITRNGATVVDATGMDGAYIRNLMVDTLQIKGEAVTKNDIRTAGYSGNGNAGNNTVEFWFYCSDSGNLLVYGDQPTLMYGNTPVVSTLFADERKVPLNNSGLMLMPVSAGQSVRVRLQVPLFSLSGYVYVRYGAMLLRR